MPLMICVANLKFSNFPKPQKYCVLVNLRIPGSRKTKITFNWKGVQMRILFINNSGGGYADYIDVESGITIDQLFNEKMPDENSSDHLIRVNRQPVPKDYILQEGDRVTITPTKIEGAFC